MASSKSWNKMVSSKSLFLLFSVLLFSVLVLLISSEVVTAGQESKTDGVADMVAADIVSDGYRVCPIRRCKYGCCRRCRNSPGCSRCCATAHEAPDSEFEDDVKN